MEQALIGVRSSEEEDAAPPLTPWRFFLTSPLEHCGFVAVTATDAEGDEEAAAEKSSLEALEEPLNPRRRMAYVLICLWACVLLLNFASFIAWGFFFLNTPSFFFILIVRFEKNRCRNWSVEIDFTCYGYR